MKITDIERIEQLHDGRLLGHCHIDGVPFHCEFVRVKTENPPWKSDYPGAQIAYLQGDAEERFFDMCQYDEGGAFRTVQVPGHEGDWVLFITPFCH